MAVQFTVPNTPRVIVKFKIGGGRGTAGPVEFRYVMGEHSTYEKLIRDRAGDPAWVPVDGPPSGLPTIEHVLRAVIARLLDPTPATAAGVQMTARGVEVDLGWAAA